MCHSVWKCPPKTMATVEELPPLLIQTLLSCLLKHPSPPLSVSLSCMYSFTLSFHLTTDPPLLLSSFLH